MKTQNVNEIIYNKGDDVVTCVSLDQFKQRRGAYSKTRVSINRLVNILKSVSCMTNSETVDIVMAGQDGGPILVLPVNVNVDDKTDAGILLMMAGEVE